MKLDHQPTVYRGLMITTVDLNCDIGEGFDNDAELMQFISSANIACGYHAGDEATMRRTVELALQNGVAIGAHPGYQDRANFGRTKMELKADGIKGLISEQLESLSAVCSALGTKIHHVKPHGALYNQAAADRRLASVIAETISSFDGTLLLYGLSGSFMIEEAERAGLVAASEVFADRTYLSDGSLTPRSQPNALIADNETAMNQVLDMVKYRRVRSTDAIMVPINAETICLHGDGANAVSFARLIRERLKAVGIKIEPPRKPEH